MPDRDKNHHPLRPVPPALGTGSSPIDNTKGEDGGGSSAIDKKKGKDAGALALLEKKRLGKFGLEILLIFLVISVLCPPK